MNRFFVSLLLVLLLVPAVAVAQGSAVPSLTVSEVRFAAGGTGPYVIMVRPDGQGPALTDARDLAGNPVDASVEVFVLSEDRTPWASYPWEDVWVTNVADTAPFRCGTIYNPYHAAGFRMDPVNADSEGRLVFSAPPASGGWSDGESNAMLNGDFLRRAPLQLRWNSPDIDGDLSVDLTDAGFFAEDLAAGYHFRSDLVYDGVLNLSDVGLMTNSLGAACP